MAPIISPTGWLLLTYSSFSLAWRRRLQRWISGLRRIHPSACILVCTSWRCSYNHRFPNDVGRVKGALIDWAIWAHPLAVFIVIMPFLNRPWYLSIYEWPGSTGARAGSFASSRHIDRQHCLQIPMSACQKRNEAGSSKTSAIWEISWSVPYGRKCVCIVHMLPNVGFLVKMRWWNRSGSTELTYLANTVTECKFSQDRMACRLDIVVDPPQPWFSLMLYSERRKFDDLASLWGTVSRTFAQNPNQKCLRVLEDTGLG